MSVLFKHLILCVLQPSNCKTKHYSGINLVSELNIHKILLSYPNKNTHKQIKFSNAYLTGWRTATVMMDKGWAAKGFIY